MRDERSGQFEGGRRSSGRRSWTISHKPPPRIPAGDDALEVGDVLAAEPGLDAPSWPLDSESRMITL
jgi:hypothetical protein